MKWLLDANISWRLSPFIEEHFGECAHVDSVPELDFPAKDSKIWNYAKDTGCVIITRDNDFGNLIALKGFPPKVILLKTGNNSLKFTVAINMRTRRIRLSHGNIQLLIVIFARRKITGNGCFVYFILSM